MAANVWITRWRCYAPNENVDLDSGTLSHEKIIGSGAIRLNVRHQAYFF
jgi:hypothetical protein